MSYRVNNTVFVDPVNGNDCKGKFEYPEFPFQTIQAAVKMAKKHLPAEIQVKLRPGDYYAGDFKTYDGLNFKGNGKDVTRIWGRILTKGVSGNSSSFRRLSLTSWESPMIVSQVNPFCILIPCHHTRCHSPWCHIRFMDCYLNSVWTDLGIFFPIISGICGQTKFYGTA